MSSDPRKWNIYIPVRPKAVQSVRACRGHFFPDHKVREWKAAIRPYIEDACGGDPPTTNPLKINRLVYTFKYPKSLTRAEKEAITSGVTIPYIGTADITDNLAKGLIDTCAGLVFVNDKLIWHMGSVSKVYGPVDAMEIEFEETPDVILL